MNIVVPAIVGLVLLAGLFTLAFGHRGWNWGTVAAAILSLLAAGGYVYLAARIAERERAWKQVVRKYEADILRERDAVTRAEQAAPQPIPGEKSLVALADEEGRWRRALERVDTWRGRSWKRASFTPPKADAAGTIVLAEPEAASPAADGDGADATPADGAGDAAAAPAGAPTINAGADLSVFDDVPLEEGGRFLGVFRVVAVAFDPATRRTTLQIAPSTPPDALDTRAWSKAYDSVTVYEELPVDRWMAFHRMPSQTAEDAALDPAKADPAELLAKLERLEAEFERHGTEVPGEPAAIAAKLASGEAVPGRYWAVVEFADDYVVPDAVVKRVTELLAPDIDDEGMIKKSFEKGETAEFDLQSALDLGKAVRILKVLDRRPLVDAATGLLGAAIPGGDGGLRADGIATLRRTLEAEIAALERATAQLASACSSVDAQRARFDEDRAALKDDLGQWAADVEAAEKMAAGFKTQLGRVSGSLAATVKAIGRLGQELTADVGRLAAEIDRRAPAPARAGAVPSAAQTP